MKSNLLGTLAEELEKQRSPRHCAGFTVTIEANLGQRQFPPPKKLVNLSGHVRTGRLRAVFGNAILSDKKISILVYRNGISVVSIEVRCSRPEMNFKRFKFGS
jgi:hypothetical protein